MTVQKKKRLFTSRLVLPQQLTVAGGPARSGLYQCVQLLQTVEAALHQLVCFGIWRPISTTDIHVQKRQACYSYQGFMVGGPFDKSTNISYVMHQNIV